VFPKFQEFYFGFKKLSDEQAFISANKKRINTDKAILRAKKYGHCVITSMFQFISINYYLLFVNPFGSIPLFPPDSFVRQKQS